MSLPVATASAAIPFIPGDIVDGKYVVEEILGAGGMGVVLAARHLTLDSEVAVKVLLPKFQKDAVVRERFVREARAAALLRSNHVTKILDVGVDRLGAPYIVMERLRGKDLEKIVAEGPLEEKLALEYVFQACEALGEAHAAGIIHRDLKPENLFVVRPGTAAHIVKVLDFGISKASYEEKKLTGTADVMGTPSFMSPEQFKSSRDVTPRSDVWALGAILYRLLTGSLPFDGKDYVEVCSRIMTQGPTPLEHHRPNLSPAVTAIVRRCLDKDPMQRFANAFELAEAIRAALLISKSNHQLAMAATIPFDAMPPPVSLKTPWPSQVPVPAPKKRGRMVGVMLGTAALAGLLAFGGMHRSKVMHYVHPAPIQAEAPATATTEPLEAPAMTMVIATDSKDFEVGGDGPKPAKLARRKTKRTGL